MCPHLGAKGQRVRWPLIAGCLVQTAPFLTGPALPPRLATTLGGSLDLARWTVSGEHLGEIWTRQQWLASALYLWGR